MSERELVVKFRYWLGDLEDDQVAALAENWENVMNDAALDRIDSWIIAAKTIEAIRANGQGDS